MGIHVLEASMSDIVAKRSGQECRKRACDGQSGYVTVFSDWTARHEPLADGSDCGCSLPALLLKTAICMAGLLGIGDFLHHIPMFYGLAVGVHFVDVNNRVCCVRSNWAVTFSRKLRE